MKNKITIISPVNTYQFRIDNIFNYTELFIFFVLRDISLRYRYIVIAFFWAAFPPLIMTLVFNFTLGRLIQVTPSHIPYLLFAYLGLILWNYFAAIVNRAGNSLLNNQTLITKIYFPRMILPLSSSTVSLVDFFCTFIVFLGLILFYQIDISILNVLLIIPSLAVSFLFASGLGIGFSALNAKYKDIRELLPLLMSILFFLTPVIFPVKLISHFYYPLLYLNPMMGVIDTARTGIFGSDSINWFGFLVSFISSLLFFVAGVLYFKKVESEIIDII